MGFMFFFFFWQRWGVSFMFDDTYSRCVTQCCVLMLVYSLNNTFDSKFDSELIFSKPEILPTSCSLVSYLEYCCIHIHKVPVFQTWLILCYYSEQISYLFKLFLIYRIFIFSKNRCEIIAMVLKLRLFNLFSRKIANIFLITKRVSCMLVITNAKLLCCVKDGNTTWLNY